tara:strand:- start:359 stop:1330 length:972 start_codon:yes stop_codon:yes gene_type:complete
MDMPVNFVQLKPITTRFTNQDLMAVMTQDEIREELGLEPLDEDIEIREDLAAVGNIDGNPVFNTIEEALAEARIIGCEGYHEHQYEGRTVYMACESHDTATNLSKCNCSKDEPHRLSDKTALQQFIDDCGEDISDDWEMLEEEVVDGEHLDFYFEQELNKFANAKVELARSITARPNARSEQDGVNKSFNDYYKVRYVYATDNFLTNKSGTSRQFCELMVGANKVYRKEDIVNANSLDLNPGFGHYGTEAYNLFLYKGGPQCRHFWLRRIYKTSLRNAKQPINDDEVISYTKAISEGFTIKRNDKLVAIPPQRMVDNGYYPEN